MDETESDNQVQGAGAKIATVAAFEIGFLAAREAITYCAYFLKVPVLFCFIGMMGAVLGVLQDVYPRAARFAIAPLAALLPHQIHIDTAGFLELYFVLSTLWYLLNVPVRILRGEHEKLSYIDSYLIAAGIATLGWGFVLINVPYLRVAPGTSRTGLAGTFVFFYFLTLAAFAASLRLSRLGDYIAETGNRFLRDMRRQYAAPAPGDTAQS